MTHVQITLNLTQEQHAGLLSMTEDAQAESVEDFIVGVVNDLLSEDVPEFIKCNCCDQESDR